VIDLKMERLAIVCCSALLAGIASTASANEDPLFEPGATFPDASLYKREAVINIARIAAQIIQSAGYSCKSISSVRMLPFHNSLVFVCDHNRYEYEFHDLGGRIEISIDGRVIASQ